MMYSLGTILQILSVSCLVAVIVFHSSVSAATAGTRIVGGKVITIDQTPYLVQLRIAKGGHFFCGGTLISTKYVITAAHCFDNRDYASVIVVGGASTLSDVGVQRNIASMFKHREYNPRTFHSDIAVLTLSEEMTGLNIEPVALCQQPPKEGDLVQISGWGKTGKQMPVSSQLRTIRVPIRSKATCVAEFGRFVEKNMFCASGLVAEGICNGDSGGPAIFGGQLCGVTSFMYECGVVGKTSAFTDVFSVFAQKDNKDKIYFPED